MIFLDKRSRIFSYIGIGIVGIYFFILNLFMPMISDDVHFLFVWTDFYPVDEPVLMHDLTDIFVSCANYYQFSGGRILCHFLVFLFSILDRSVFIVVNTGVFVCFVCLLQRLFIFHFNIIKQASHCCDDSEYEKRYKCICGIGSLLIFVCILFIPAFGEIFLWRSGAINYLWPCTLLLLCADLYVEKFDKWGKFGKIFILSLFFVSAFTNEVTGGILFLFLSIQTVCGRVKFNRWLIISLLILIPGILVVILAPGNGDRRSTVHAGTNVDFVQCLYLYAILFVKSFFVETIAVIKSIDMLSKEKKFTRRDASIFIAFGVSGLAGIFVLPFSGSFAGRAMSLGFVMLIPISLAFVCHILLRAKMSIFVLRVIAYIVTAGIIFVYTYRTVEYKIWSNDHENTVSEMVALCQNDRVNDAICVANEYNDKYYYNVYDWGVSFIPHIAILTWYPFYWFEAYDMAINGDDLSKLAEYIYDNNDIVVMTGKHHVVGDFVPFYPERDVE